MAFIAILILNSHFGNAVTSTAVHHIWKLEPWTEQYLAMFMYSCSASRVAWDMYIVMAAYLSVEHNYMLLLHVSAGQVPICSFDS